MNIDFLTVPIGILMIEMSHLGVSIIVTDSLLSKIVVDRWKYAILSLSLLVFIAPKMLVYSCLLSVSSRFSIMGIITGGIVAVLFNAYGVFNLIIYCVREEKKPKLLEVPSKLEIQD